MRLTEFFELEHTNLHPIDPLTLATVFSGIGAVEFALKRMNINHQILFACDKDKFVKESYMKNYGLDEGKWFSDIYDIQSHNLKKVQGNLDLFVGGSPCQAFSFVGDKNGFSDPRGLLIFEFIRLLSIINPRVFIFENVRGLKTKQKEWKVFSDALNDTGYYWKEKIINSKDFGIPQNRSRLFIVGFRSEDEHNLFNFPKNQKLHIGQKDLLLDSEILNSQFNGNVKFEASNLLNFDSDFLVLKENQYKKIPNKYFLSEKVTNYVLSTGTKNFHSIPKLDLNIARPLLSTMHKMHRAGVDNYFREKYNGKVRKLTPRECLRLMGFDDRFKQVVSDTRMYMQTGNSIVVDVLVAIIREILKAIE